MARIDTLACILKQPPISDDDNTESQIILISWNCHSVFNYLFAGKEIQLFCGIACWAGALNMSIAVVETEYTL